MRVIYKKSLEYQIVKRIEKSSKKIFLRKDFKDLGEDRQIGRVLKKLIDGKKLARIGFGIYARAHESEYTDTPLIEQGFDIASREALNRLNVKWELCEAAKAYNSGKTQQVPVYNTVRLKSRLRRKISYFNRQLYFEGNVNAK